MYQHISEYVLNSNTVFTKGYLCNCEEYVHINFILSETITRSRHGKNRKKSKYDNKNRIRR